MKKVLIVFFIILLSSSLFASSQLHIGTGNDKFSMGLANNDDDGRTFDFFVQYRDKGGVEAFVSLQAWTNRVKVQRADRLIVGLGYNYTFFEKSGFEFALGATAGLGIQGNFQLEKIQNQNHRNNKIDEVFFPYEEDRLFFDFSSTFSLSYKNNAAKLEFVDNHLWWGFIIDSGFLRFDYRHRFDTPWAMGSISVDALSLFEEPTWQQSHIYIVVGKENIQSYDFLSNAAVVPLNDNLEVYGGAKYTSGFPSSDLIDPSKFRIQRSHLLLSLGARVSFFQTSFVSPFASLGAGLASWKLLRQDMSTGLHERLGRENTFFMEASFGLKVLPEGFLRVGHSSIQGFVALNVQYFTNVSKITYLSSLDMYHKKDFAFNRFSYSVHFGLQLGMDLR